MTATQTYDFYLCALLFAFGSIMHASSSPPKIWLSEYGYAEDTSDEMKQVSFPVPQTENNFNNSFLSKTDTEVVVHGNLSFIVFTCEAEYPVSWFVHQELKSLSEELRTRTYKFQGSPKDNITYFRSLIDIYLDKLEFYFDTDEYYPPIYSEKWDFSCQQINARSELGGGSSITLNLEQSLTFDQNLNELILNEKIIIAVLCRQNNISTNASGYNLNYVRRHYPNFDNQPIILGKNFSISLDEFDDSVENIKLVEYEGNQPIKEGDVIQIICLSSQTLYSYGAYVDILWENGTEISLPEEIYGLFARPEIYLSGKSKHLAEQFLLDDDYSAEGNMLYFLSKEITVDLDMKQINCYMPVWLNGKWDKVSLEINAVPK